MQCRWVPQSPASPEDSPSIVTEPSPTNARFPCRRARLNRVAGDQHQQLFGRHLRSFMHQPPVTR